MTQGWRRFGWKSAEPLVLNYTHLAEPATVEGYLLHPDGRPWINKTIKLYPQRTLCPSEKSGRFSFQRIDLSQYSHLLLSNGQYVPLNQYEQNLYVYMNGREVGYATSYAPRTKRANPADRPGYRRCGRAVGRRRRESPPMLPTSSLQARRLILTARPNDS